MLNIQTNIYIIIKGLLKNNGVKKKMFNTGIF